MAAELKARFTADDSDLTRKMAGIQKNLGKFGGAVAAAVSVGAVVAFARSILTAGKELQEMSQALELPIRNVEVLTQLGEDAGVSMEKMQMAASRIDNARMEALSDATSKSAQAMARLGITTEELQTLSNSKFIERFAQAMAKSKDTASGQSAALDVLGNKSAAVQVALSALATDGFDKLSESMQASGQIMGDQLADNLAEAQKVLKDFGDQLTVLSGKVISWAITVATFMQGFWKNALSKGGLQESFLAGFDAIEQRAKKLAEIVDATRKAEKAPDGGFVAADKLLKISEQNRTSSIGAIGGKIGTGFAASNLDAMERQQVGLQKDIKSELVKLNGKSSDFGVR
jgi:hypothetical protein